MFEWPKRDKDGRHVVEPVAGDTVKFKSTYENTGNAKPLSELLKRVDPDIVEQSLKDAKKEIGYEA